MQRGRAAVAADTEPPSDHRSDAFFEPLSERTEAKDATLEYLGDQLELTSAQ